ncbi:unnamed protein product [Lactuca virosa]|uniref:Uncharacterized protein n=1 Tax=Lactuca virosa TaxID=75947 RepID=A0AAU9N9G5_9ASTR|nr:unnamed protein product [Lactuca virosa]
MVNRQRLIELRIKDALSSYPRIASVVCFLLLHRTLSLSTSPPTKLIPIAICSRRHPPSVISDRRHPHHRQLQPYPQQN